jgi:DNA processing protein
VEEKTYWLGFSVFPGVGPKRFALLLKKFGSAKDMWNASSTDLGNVIGKELTKKFDNFRSSFSLHSYTKSLSKMSVSFLTLTDKAYPKLLKEIDDPPFILYIKGIDHLNDIYHLSGKVVGVVGTRRITSYGTDVTRMITRELVRAGCVIVSGLALGVDAIAHETTIDLGGKTIAVLGCGVDLCYPSSNQHIYNSILASGGLVVSEYPLSMQPSKGSFPSRNRIIAGLSDAVVVTEGDMDSGALITAEEAIKNGRKVFAVPGPITSSLSKGPLKLLQQGAKIVTSGGDILKELNVTTNPPSLKLRRAKGETVEEQRIIDLLENEELYIDELIRETGLQAAKLGVILSMMEMKGCIKSTQSGKYHKGE